MESKNKENPNEDFDDFITMDDLVDIPPKGPIQPIKKDESPKNEIEPNKIIIESKQNPEENELKIELYPNNIPKGKLEKISVSSILPKDRLGCSLDKDKNLAFPRANVPILYGFYTAHCNHYPIRIKPDDIWLLIVQAFSYHVNANSEALRELFVDFEGKKDLKVIYPDIFSIKEVDEKTLENFSIQINEQMKKYLGEEIIQTLTSDFSTTNYDSLIVSKLSIMGAFKKYFYYEMGICVCGIPYIILEGTADDYQKIKTKAEKLSKFKFDWYIDRIIPHIQKMIDAKKGKVDNDYFRNIIQRNEVVGTIYNGCMPPEEGLVSEINGWILDFFAYEKGEYINFKYINFKRFSAKSLKVDNFGRLVTQMLSVPFTIKEIMRGKTYEMNYNVGFIGCDQNEKKEVFPVQAWVVSEPPLNNDRNGGFKDPIPPKKLEINSNRIPI